MPVTFGFAALALLVLAGAQAQAGEPAAATMRENELNEIFDLMQSEQLMPLRVSVGTRFAVDIAGSPSIVTIFTRTDIDSLQAHQLIDLLRYVPGFYEVASPLGRNFAIRGVHGASADHFVVLIDGVPMNDPLTNTASPDMFSLDYAERVEIIRGPGSAIYGASALMSVINIITRSATEKRLVETLSLGTSDYLRNHLGYMDKVGDTTFLFSGTFWKSDGTRRRASAEEDVLIPALGQNIADGIQPGENLTVPRAATPVFASRYGPSVDVFLKAARASDWALRAGFTRVDAHAQRTDRQGLIDIRREIEPPRYINQTLRLDGDKQWGARDRFGMLVLRPSLQLYDHDYRAQSLSRDFADEASRQGLSVVNRWSGKDVRLRSSLDYSLELPAVGFLSDNILLASAQIEYNVMFDYEMQRCYVDEAEEYDPSVHLGDHGVDLYCLAFAMVNEGMRIDIDRRVTDTDTSHAGDGDETRAGGAWQASTKLFDRVNLLAGGRVDYHTDFDTRLSSRVAMTGRLGGGVYAKAQYASAFVYPSFLYRTGNSRSDFLGNLAIEPQSSTTYEGALGFIREGLITAEVNGYYNIVKDFITFDLQKNGRTGQFFFSNQGDLRIAGLEAHAHLILWRQRLRLRANAATARVLDGSSKSLLVDDQLGGASKYPDWLATASADVLPWDMLRLNLAVRYAGRIQQAISNEARFDNILGTDGETHSSLAPERYHNEVLLVDAAASVMVLKGWTLRLAATNLLDTRYHRPGAVLVPQLAEGRLVWVDVAYELD